MPLRLSLCVLQTYGKFNKWLLSSLIQCLICGEYDGCVFTIPFFNVMNLLVQVIELRSLRVMESEILYVMW